VRREGGGGGGGVGTTAPRENPVIRAANIMKSRYGHWFSFFFFLLRSIIRVLRPSEGSSPREGRAALETLGPTHSLIE
jgi:hypothetical protein